jgi:serine acetyltransferase
MFDNLRADLRASTMGRCPDLDHGFWKEDLHSLIQFQTIAVVSHRFSHWTLSVRIPVVRQLLQVAAFCLQRWTMLWTGIYIFPDAEIGPGFAIHSAYGINIGATRIGRNCTVQSGVLIAAGCRGVGDNVYFGAGSKLIGDAAIGNNVIIVANSLVLTDVKDNTTVMGVPARIRLPGGRPKKFTARVRTSDPPVGP